MKWNPSNIFRNKINNNIITENSFSDVHHYYDKNDYIHEWSKILKSNLDLWQNSLENSTNGKKILIATLGGGFSHRPFMTMDTIIGIALTLRGAEVHSYFCDHALPVCLKAEHAYIKPEVIHQSYISQTLCKGCYKDISALSLQLGFPTHTIGTLATLAERQNAKAIAQGIKLSVIKDYKIDGVSVGKHAESGAMRYFAHSNPVAQPLGSEILRRYLEATIISYYATKKLLSQNKFDAVCLTHGIYTPHGVISDTCELFGVTVFNWTIGYLKNRFIFTKGDILRSLLQSPNDIWENMQWSSEHEKRIMDYLDSRWSNSKDWLPIPKENQSIPFSVFAKEKNLNLNKPIIGLLTNIIWESYADYTSRVFPDILSWIRKTIIYFKKREDLQLLIRIHPGENKGHVSMQLVLDEIKKMFSKLPANIFIINSDENINTYEAMQQCDSVIVYQTQTGLELAAYGIPIILAGDAWMRNKGIAYEPTSEDEYYKYLNLFPLNKRLSQDKILRARKFAYHAFFRNALPLSCVEQTNDWLLYKPAFSNVEDLLPNRDKGLDIICEGILQNKQIIYPQDTFECNALQET